MTAESRETAGCGEKLCGRKAHFPSGRFPDDQAAANVLQQKLPVALPHAASIISAAPTDDRIRKQQSLSPLLPLCVTNQTQLIFGVILRKIVSRTSSASF